MHDRTLDGMNDPPEKLRPEGAPLIKEVLDEQIIGMECRVCAEKANNIMKICNKCRTAMIGIERFISTESGYFFLKTKLGRGQDLNIADSIDDYSCGIINDYGGGNVQWWQDYIRSEIASCNEHWKQALKEE